MHPAADIADVPPPPAKSKLHLTLRYEPAILHVERRVNSGLRLQLCLWGDTHRWGVLRACFRGGRGVGIEKRDQTVGGYFVWEGDGGSFQGEQSERGEVGDAVLRAQRFVARLGLCQLEPVLHRMGSTPTSSVLAKLNRGYLYGYSNLDDSTRKYKAGAVCIGI